MWILHPARHQMLVAGLKHPYILHISIYCLLLLISVICYADSLVTLMDIYTVVFQGTIADLFAEPSGLDNLKGANSIANSASNTSLSAMPTHAVASSLNEKQFEQVFPCLHKHLLMSIYSEQNFIVMNVLVCMSLTYLRLIIFANRRIEETHEVKRSPKHISCPLFYFQYFEMTANSFLISFPDILYSCGLLL